jgi:hypothetical protein
MYHYERISYFLASAFYQNRPLLVKVNQVNHVIIGWYQPPTVFTIFYYFMFILYLNEVLVYRMRLLHV